VHVAALEAFVAAHGIPVTGNALATENATRILVVDADRNATEAVRQVFEDLGGYVVETASDALSAAIACGASVPDVVVFDVSGGDPVAFISALRNRPGFQTTRFFASGPAFTDDGISLVRRGYEAALWLNWPLNFVRRRMGFGYWSLSSYLKYRVKSAVNFIGDFEKNLAAEAARREVDGVICGHIHHAASRQFDKVHYLNTGDWVESCTAIGETEAGKFEMIRWLDVVRERERVAAAPAKLKAA
jgi:CheY-like chemotaxis protein